MAIGFGSLWVGKGSPFCLAWLVNSVADAMSSIEEMFCGIMWLLAIVHDELWYNRRLLRIDLLIFRTTVPVCSRSLSLMAAMVYVDLPLKKLRHLLKWSPLLFFDGKCSHKGWHYCGALCSSWSPTSSPTLAITRKLSHCIGLTLWFIPQQIVKQSFVHKCSKLMKLAATPQLASLRAFVEASYVLPSSQRVKSPFKSSVHDPCVV